MEMFMDRLKPREVYDLAEEIMMLYKQYHGTIQEIISIPYIGTDTFRMLSKEGKVLMLKIKGRLDKIGKDS